mgnify:CR=1 FL=1
MKFSGFIIVALLLLAHPAYAETARVTVNGMVCAFCAQGIEKSFGQMDEVASSKADLDNRLVTISIKPTKKLADAAIEKAIRDNGLDPVKIERTKP